MEPSHWTGNISHADGWADAPPIVVVAKSAQLRFRLRRKLRPLPCSSSPHRAGHGGAPYRDIKKKMRRARWKRKNVRRVGLRPRRPPAAGGGWLPVPCGSQRWKRPALGEIFGPGKSGIHPASLFAAAGPVVDESLRNGPIRASAPTTARAARSDCAAVGGFAAYGCGVPLAGKRNARKEEPVEHW